ncbi:putative mitochondrial chaperone BCS1-B [Cyphellophora attinorum]|uniref:Putative mitochondrial chaperone BCS1-B n=1 Tax=Cyphellophora attinorum TaxID=1664694 RepID=A0A0N1P1H1_9EURO|nr:putative mitochondrial chaperone BCS1-B [Phialophora attinorum]KPI42173.1 putative mitochondrial chaperone BCS1-B [Phialophora attinorum]
MADALAAWRPPGSPRPSIGSDAASDLLGSIPTMLAGGTLGLPAYIIQIFPQVLAKLAKYPRLSKLMSVLLTIVLASYLNATKVTEAISATWSQFISLFTASITIDGDDPFVLQVQNFLRKKKILGQGNNMLGESSYQILKRDQEDCPDDDYDDWGNPIDKQQNGDEEKPFKMVLHSTRSMLLFRHKGRSFLVRRDRDDSTYNPGFSKSLRFFCFGWSTKPITELFADIDRGQKVVQSQDRLTSIRSSGQEHGYGNWSRPQNRLARPISTVNLDEGQKEMIVQDIAEYLHPETKAWYQQQGIPYRRGYLFYGPPGTGKSSLAMALAGQFKLDIHIISLLDKNLDDYNLNRLMKSMIGRPCVLLEDIDSAGVSRDFQDDSDDDSDDDYNTRYRKQQAKSRVTLSGLLNAIDGVGAPEGQVLIMTTNHKEKLDDALIRAGRVDVSVKLAWASRPQAREIFMRMYRRRLKTTVKVATKCTCEADASGSNEEELAGLADRFCEQIPEYKVSPAELQDFILMRKSSPQKAVNEIKAWADQLIREREEAEAEVEKKKKQKEQRRKDRRKKRHGEWSEDDEDADTEKNTEDGDGKTVTPPSGFEDVVAKEKKEGLLKWLVKQVINGPDPIPVAAVEEVAQPVAVA